MSWIIQIHRAKPNPVGKDKDRWGTPKPQQLLGEWADLKNIGDQAVSSVLIRLSNTEFHASCVPKPSPSFYWEGHVSLQPGEILRVHTGRSIDVLKMSPEDWRGVNQHAYAERGSFVLNNDCGDLLGVYWQGSDRNLHKEDSASYDPNPPEGEVLIRNGSKLTPSLVSWR
jgi:hypothetical protein